jgi:hypothetical protein
LGWLLVHLLWLTLVIGILIICLLVKVLLVKHLLIEKLLVAELFGSLLINSRLLLSQSLILIHSIQLYVVIVNWLINHLHLLIYCINILVYYNFLPYFFSNFYSLKTAYSHLNRS